MLGVGLCACVAHLQWSGGMPPEKIYNCMCLFSMYVSVDLYLFGVITGGSTWLIIVLSILDRIQIIIYSAIATPRCLICKYSAE